MKNRFITLILFPVLMAAFLPANASGQQSYTLDDLVTIGLDKNPRILAQTMQAEADLAA